MKKNEVKVSAIIEFLGSDLLGIKGKFDENMYVDNLADMEHVDEYTLDWINPDRKNKQEVVESSKATVSLVDEYITYSDILAKKSAVLLIVPDPKICLAKIGRHFFTDRIKSTIHPTAIINEKASIGHNVSIGAYTVIGNCKIGDNTKIYPNVVIYDNAEIGKNTVIHSGVIIRADGLGCIRKEDGELIEFPQLGKVIVGDNVYLGANMQVASGALSDTIIGDGCKINALSFIGCNCHLGKNVWITGSTMLSGSVIVEDNVTIYSRVIIREHIKIGKGAIIGMGSVVTRNIPAGETWWGSPAKRK